MRFRRVRLSFQNKIFFIILIILTLIYYVYKQNSLNKKFRVINFVPEENFEQSNLNNKIKKNMDPDTLEFGMDINDMALKLATKNLDKIKSTQKSKLFDSKFSSQKLVKTISKDFISDLKRIKDKWNRVLLSIVDEEYVDFALNFNYFSIQKHKIKNHLFVCLDDQSKAYLFLHNISCHLFNSVKMFKTMIKFKSSTSNFGTLSFSYKTNFKTAIMLQALSKGFNVLLVDVDIIFFKNPFDYFNCTDCDLEIQMDRYLYNSGFVFARATPRSIALYETSWNFFIRYQSSHDQSYLNMAVDYLSKADKLPNIRKLPQDLFQIGVHYFEHKHRMFENKPICDNCVLVHNNYLGSVAAKKYRFRENLLWMVDRDRYYSDVRAKYMTYRNPVMFDEGTAMWELAALRTAVAISLVLKRILILPKFHCCECPVSDTCSNEMFQCSLLSVLNVEVFEKNFYKKFRENSFLKHPLVPKSVKTSKSPVLYINSTENTLDQNMPNQKYRILQSKHKNGATIGEFEDMMSEYSNFSVLTFYSLYGDILQYEREESFKVFMDISKKIFICSEYEQWNYKNM